MSDTRVRTYRSPHGREMKMLRTVQLGYWFHWSPFDGQPRVIIVLRGRKFVWVSANRGTSKPLERLATGWTITIRHVGTLSTLAAR